MAINFPNGLSITSSDAVDTRIVLTKSEMLAMKKARLPQVYFAICKDDGNLYLYNSENEVDEETGRYRLIKTGSQEPTIWEDLDEIVSDQEGNIIQITEGGLYVEDSKEISEETIKDLFEKQQ